MEELRAEFPDTPEVELAALLTLRKGNVKEAAAQHRATKAWRATLKMPTIADVAPFMRSGPGASGPDGCVVVLEDMKGDCARDRKGRPIVVSIGMSHGSALEQQQMMIYATERAATYCKDGNLSFATVLEVAARKGATATFRFPDPPTRSVMDLQRQHYPVAVVSSTTFFCGLPRFVTYAFALCKPFMAKQMYDAMVLKPNYKHLSKHIDPACMLKEWGGELEFDIDAYIRWRAEEEGVELDHTLVRRFDPRAQQADAAATHPLEGASSLTLEQMEGLPKRFGPVHKRGSGVGLFATTKWKPKLFAVLGGHCMYFTGTEVSEANKVDRYLSLEGAYVERLTSATDKGPNGRSGAEGNVFQVVAPARNFILACKTAQEVDAWVEVLEREIEAAATAAREGGNALTVLMAPMQALDLGEGASE